MGKRDILKKALVEWRRDGYLSSLSEYEFGTLMEHADEVPPFPWAKPVLAFGVACLLGGIIVLCSTGDIMRLLRQLPSEFLAAVFFLFSTGLRVWHHYCGRPVLRRFVAAFSCAGMIAAAAAFCDFMGPDGPWMLFAGLFCAFIPDTLSAYFAVAAMNFGLCFLGGETVFPFEFRIMLLAFPMAALSFWGKIPARFAHPSMAMGLGTACVYTLEGNFFCPDLLAGLGVAAASGLFWLATRLDSRALKAWGYVTALAMVVVETLLHLDGSIAAAALLEVLCAFAFLLVWYLDRKKKKH